MKKTIGNLTINELLDYLKKKCRKINCDACPFRYEDCASFKITLTNLIEDIGENTLFEGRG